MSQKNIQVKERPVKNKTIIFSKQAKKSIENLRSDKKFDYQELIDTLSILASGKPLDSSYNDHKLAKQSPGILKYCRNYHLKSNIVVIYWDKGDVIEVQDVGKHNKTRMTSSLQR